MLTKVPLLRVLLVGVAVGAVAGATVVVSERSGGSAPRVPVAATTRAAAGHVGSLRNTTNVGGDTHGNPSGNATFNGNDHGTADPPTPGLAALVRGITVTSRSVSAVVHAPAGLAVSNTTEISVLFGNRRISRNYDRSAGTTIAFDYPVGDGTRRNEVLTINLTEQAPGGAVAYHVNRLASIEPLFEVTISDLTFTLLNDCDPIGDSEVALVIMDDRDVVEVDMSMSADQVRHVHQLSRHLPAARVSDQLVVPQISFTEDDLGGYRVHSAKPTTPPLLPGTSRHEHYDLADPADEFCNAHVDYVIGINLLTFTSL